MSDILKKHYKPPFTAMNIKRHDEPVATNAVYLDNPTIDNGCKHAHIFVCTNIMFTDFYGMKTEPIFQHTQELHT